MDKTTQELLNGVNGAIIKFRGIYAEWSKRHAISYNEMLVLYTIREYGYCTQKQICDSYLLPRQTINNVITKMRDERILELNKDKCVCREKAFSLSQKGMSYYEVCLNSLNKLEEEAVNKMGREKFEAMTGLILEYDAILSGIFQ